MTILTSTRTRITHLRVRELADGIIETRRREIVGRKAPIAELEGADRMPAPLLFIPE